MEVTDILAMLSKERRYTLGEITAAMAVPYAKAKAAPTAERAADLLSQGLIDALKALPVTADGGSYASPND